MFKHEIFERNSLILLIGILVAVSIGGLVEIAPLFYLKSTIEKVEGMRPYTPLELAGRDIYIREGCYTLPVPVRVAARRYRPPPRRADRRARCATDYRP